ncbi:diphthine--ammonia ligase [Candidatus Micrarchaeota archaeon]|nr:diphthine--ammonia ligase [Candidatus Micrarchaeota archaeon]
MKAACLFSGGKDSCFSTFWALSQGFEVSLITMQSEEYSMMFHHPNIELTKMQAEAANIPHILVQTNKENELADLQKAIKESEADAIVTGAIASDYQRQRIEQIGNNLGIATHSPLWHKQEILMKEMLENFEIYVVAVSAEGLGPEFLGKPYSELLEKLPKNIHPFLEGGEGETFVTDSPFFSKKIMVDEWKKEWDGSRGIANIVKAHFE